MVGGRGMTAEGKWKIRMYGENCIKNVLKRVKNNFNAQYILLVKDYNFVWDWQFLMHTRENYLRWTMLIYINENGVFWCGSESGK